MTGKVPFPGGTTADKARAPRRVAAAGPAAAELRLEPRLRRGDGRHDGQGPGQRIAQHREVRRRLEPFLAAGAAPFVPAAAPAAVVAVAAPPIVRPRVRAAGLQHGLPARQRQYATSSPAAVARASSPSASRGQGGRATTRPPGNGIWPLALLVLTPIALVAAVLLVRYLVIAMLR